MKKFKHTPLSAAKALRVGFESLIAKTTGDYLSQQYHVGSWLDAFRFSILVYEQCGYNLVRGDRVPKGFSLRVRKAVEQVCPEFFAEYWEKIFQIKA